ncbi:hypothetical protein [Sphingopyxis sp.]|jgi:hypothetical protein|uniref:hypothetical protein n=1 Tax=Sphingopyxis sp. TaxID=1908224 RepID=UPI002FC84323
MTHPISATANQASGYRVDISRGQRIGRVSSEWFSRPDDERYLSLSDLFEAVRYFLYYPSRRQNLPAFKVIVEALRFRG